VKTTPTWRARFREARSLARHAEACTDRATRRTLLVRAARIVVDIERTAELRTDRGAFVRAAWAVEKLIGSLAHGCVGCLAFGVTPEEERAIGAIQRNDGAWFELCATHYRAALRPKLDGGAPLRGRRDGCYVCGTPGAFEYAPRLWAGLKRRRSEPNVSHEELVKLGPKTSRAIDDDGARSR
jgi:hypothetical protein